jgi:protein involved in sex pheromone biosynthesis
MKKVLTITLTALFFVVILSACGTKKGGNCDAYGYNNSSDTQELANK